MAESSTDTHQWHCVGKVEDLKRTDGRKIYMESGTPLALFYLDPKRFFIFSAICPHAKGPLEQGDIEDLGDCVKVVCPLHFYSFDVETGQSASGLRLTTYKTEIRGDNLYVFSPEPVSLEKTKLSSNVQK
ncbi:3-phenylpropionate/cinnamic acid dioxygenase ferredoxin subunit [Plakobranchus ocellatus]|uniref:3-phenylpropionate/cinnamic acid dioxygenase ferredoxin subunit n=1 Tax=Plakobranchus ocellatus TaxID=259542 RepID=A0AAV3YEG0_9GAST|nr:3-phenylpropionate/cinnamic acid dioxygenase ferredoxin subunit [Plakobranchus ocellatus]